MKQYIYRPEECGLSDWPPGTLRLAGIPVADKPEDADVFVYPGAMHHFQVRDLERLLYFRGNENRHIFFHCADHETLYGKPCLFIRCNTRDWYFARDPNTISWPWPVEDYAECMDVPPGGFTFDVSFQGWRSAPIRERSVDSIRASRLRFDVAEYPDFTGYLPPDSEELARRRLEFRRSMRESRLALAPESIPGVLPYRFFEAMSAGRVPFLIGSHYVLPLADEIPYEQFCLFLKDDVPYEGFVEARNRGTLGEAATNRAAEVAADFLSRHSDADLIAMGRLARHYWESFLDSRRWPEFMARTVQKRFGAVTA